MAEHGLVVLAHLVRAAGRLAGDGGRGVRSGGECRSPEQGGEEQTAIHRRHRSEQRARRIT